MRVIVLAGGNSPEREVSLRSGAAVAVALQSAGHTVSTLDTANGLEVYEAAIRQSEVVFPVLHGAGGEDGSIQSIFEEWQVPYVGSDAASSRLCFDKWQYKQFLQPKSIILPEGILVDKSGFDNSPLRHQPFVLKPHDGGSSLDTYIVRQPDLFDADEAFNKHSHMLLEELISGQETTVGILENMALPAIEIIPPIDGEFDYANKYNGKTRELCPPVHISADIQASAQAVALQAHRLCGCRHFSRSDFLVHESGTIYLLETNTIPGMTDQSLLPKMAAAAGYTMPQLCDHLIRMAVVK